MKFIKQKKENDCLPTSYYNLCQWLGKDNISLDYLNNKVQYRTYGSVDEESALLKEVCGTEAKILGTLYDPSYLEYGDFLNNPNNLMIMSMPTSENVFHSFVMTKVNDKIGCINSYESCPDVVYEFNYVFYDYMLKIKTYNDLFYCSSAILITKDKKLKALDEIISMGQLKKYDPEKNMKPNLFFLTSAKILGYTGEGSSQRIKDYSRFTNKPNIYELV